MASRKERDIEAEGKSILVQSTPKNTAVRTRPRLSSGRDGR